MCLIFRALYCCPVPPLTLLQHSSSYYLYHSITLSLYHSPRSGRRSTRHNFLGGGGSQFGVRFQHVATATRLREPVLHALLDIGTPSA